MLGLDYAEAEILSREPQLCNAVPRFRLDVESSGYPWG